MTDPNPKIPFYRKMFKNLTVRLVLVYEMPQSAKDFAAQDISKLLEQDKLIHRVVQTLPLSRIAEGDELIEKGGLLGCVILNND